VPCGKAIRSSIVPLPFRFDKTIRQLLSKCKGSAGKPDAKLDTATAWSWNTSKPHLRWRRADFLEP